MLAFPCPWKDTHIFSLCSNHALCRLYFEFP